MRRELSEVLNSIKEEIPEDQVDLLKQLNSVRESVAYSPPENHGLWWGEFAMILGNFFPNREDVKADWQKKIIALWMDE